MTEFKTLFWLELRSLYGINRYLHLKDKKEKNRYRLLAGGWIFLMLVIFGYAGGLVFGLCSLGLSEIVPAYLVMIASILLFFVGIFKAGNMLFDKKGYDMLSSMPIRKQSIVMSRFAVMYAEDLIFTFLIMLPGLFVFVILEQPSFGFYMTALFGILCIPAVPLVISILLGTVIMAISSRLKYKNLVQIVLMISFVIAVLLSSFTMTGSSDTWDLEAIASFADMAGDLIETLYLPAMWLGQAMIYGKLFGLFLFMGISFILIVLAIWFTANTYDRIMRGLSNISSKHTYQIGHMESRNMLYALYIREGKRYFSSALYVTNTIIGPIMGLIFSVFLCFSGLETLVNSIPFSLDIKGAVPFAVAAVFCMMTTTSVSISMEGKQFWVIRSLPISAKTLFDSKILWNLGLMLPFYVLSEIFLMIAVKPTIWERVWLILIPFLMMLFSTVFGITVNVKFHRFDWEKEAEVVKQGASAAIGGFAGMLLSLIFAGVFLLVPSDFGHLTRAVICMLLVLATLFCYQKNNRTRLEEL